MISLELLSQADGWFWTLFISALIGALWIFISIKTNRKLSALYLLRIIGLAIVIFLLFQPKISWKNNHQYPLHWNIYIDKSVSMAYHQSISPQLFIDEIDDFLELVQEKNGNLEVYLFDQDVSEFEGQKFHLDGPTTDISNVHKHISEAADYLMGAIIISDGQVTKGNIDQNQLTQFSVPIYSIGVGDTIPMVDIAVMSISAPTVAIKGEEVDIDVSIITQGELNDRINVLLYNGSKLIGSKYIHIVGEGTISKAKFRISSQTLGKNKYVIKTSVLEDEININNNRLPFEITVLKDRYNIALLTGAANFNTGPVKKIIESFPRASLDHFIQLGDSFKPSLSEFWSKPYELIIFDNFPLKPVSNRWQRIFAKKLVSNKSSLLYLAGPSITSSSAASLFPFLHVKLSKRSPKNIDKMNWYWVENNSYVKELSSNVQNQYDYLMNSFPPLIPKLFVTTNDEKSSLAMFDNISSPLLVFNEKDGLRSSLWTASDLFTLYYKLTESDYKDFSKDLFGDIFSWLMRTSGENELYFRFNKSIYQQGEEIYVSGTHARFEERDIGRTKGSVNLFHNDKKIKSYELNYNPTTHLWENRFLAGKPGTYTYSILMEIADNSYEEKGQFTIDESQIELNQVSVNKPYLISQSKKTGGTYVPWKSRAENLGNIHESVRTETVIRKASLHENIYIIIILILLLSTEWYIRRMIGLS